MTNRRAGDRRARGRPRRLSDQVLAWAEEQIAAGLSTKAEVLALLGIHRTTLERRLTERRRQLLPLPLPPGGFRCPVCDQRSSRPVCPRGHLINPTIPDRPPAA